MLLALMLVLGMAAQIPVFAARGNQERPTGSHHQGKPERPATPDEPDEPSEPVKPEKPERPKHGISGKVHHGENHGDKLTLELWLEGAKHLW